MRQIVFLIACTFLLFGCNSKTAEIPIEDTLGYIATDNVDSLIGTPWMTAYLDYLRTDSLQCNLVEYWCWGLAYIDNDDIPELVLMCSGEAQGKEVLSMYDGRVSMWNSWRNGVDYVPRKGLIRNEDGSMGFYYDRFVRLEKGVFTEYLKYEIDEYNENNCFTILNSDTVCKGYGDCDVLKQEQRRFESLPYLELEAIRTYHIDVLMEHLEKMDGDKGWAPVTRLI